MLDGVGRWLRRLLFAGRASLRDPTLYPLGRQAPFDVEFCAETFMRNQELIHSCASRLGARALTYLQPSNGTGRRQVSATDIAALAHIRRRQTVDGVNQVEALDRFLDRVRAQVAGRVDGTFHDLTDIFDRTRQGVYVDHAHPSDVGYDIIARRIADDILRLEDESS